MLLPAVCPACGARGAAPCAPCVATMRRPPPQPAPPATDACTALLDYSGAARELVARLKYRNARGSLPWLAGAMGSLVDPAALDVVTWAPTTRARRRQRGFDQARLLAKAVARTLALPCRPLLVRDTRDSQTGRGAESRRAGVAFHTRGAVHGRVLLVDDVVTTGTTVASAARALRQAGATEVRVLAAARTPLRQDHVPVCQEVRYSD